MAHHDEQEVAWNMTYGAVIGAGGTAATAATLADYCVLDYAADPDMDHFHQWATGYSAHLSTYTYPQANLATLRTAAQAAGAQARVDYDNVFLVNHNRRSG